MKTRRLLFGIIGLSLILRIAAAFYMGDHVVELPGTADQLSYHTLALRVMNGYGFSFDRDWWPATAAGAPTAHWSYLYTFYLTALYALFGPHPLIARLLQAILVGILQPILTYLITRRIFERLNEKSSAIALAAAGASAIYTYFVYYSAALMTEPFFITSVLGSLYLTILCAEQATYLPEAIKQPRHTYFLALLLGIVTSIAILLRQLYLLFVPFIFLWIWWKRRSRSLWSLFLIAGIVVVAIFPFTVYNYFRFNRFVLLNTNAGYVLFWANHPYYGTHFVPILSPETYHNLIPRELLHLDEAALDQALLRLGVQYILQDPVRYGLLSLSRIPIYFEFWPSRQDGLVSNLARLGGFGLFLPFMVVGLIRGWLLLIRKIKSWHQILSSSVFFISLFMFFYTGLHIFAWSLIRYRLPVDAFLLSFAGLSMVEFTVWISGRTKLPLPGLPDFLLGESTRDQSG